MAHISFDSSNLTKFVNPNELGEMQALVTAVDKELREGTGAGNDFRGFLNLPVDYDKEEFARIKEAANGKPVLVAYWFKHDLIQIKSRFKVREIKTPRDIQDWNAGKIPLALIHPASAGHGLNLQAGGATLIWYGLTWSLELYQQTNARLWRQGQRQPVVIHHIITEGTIDENILVALKRKDKTQLALINAVKANLKGSVMA